jgi:sulfur-oxidizing protein SoxZ
MTRVRVQWPDKISAGEVVKVRMLIQHPMDTGYLQDFSGKLVPRNVIQSLTCTLGGQEVFRVVPSSGVSANPYFEFFVRATNTTEFKIEWTDDKGVKGQHLQIFNVTS